MGGMVSGLGNFLRLSIGIPWDGIFCGAILMAGKKEVPQTIIVNFAAQVEVTIPKASLIVSIEDMAREVLKTHPDLWKLESLYSKKKPKRRS